LAQIARCLSPPTNSAGQATFAAAATYELGERPLKIKFEAAAPHMRKPRLGIINPFNLSIGIFTFSLD
jgi:hypothetical protein